MDIRKKLFTDPSININDGLIYRRYEKYKEKKHKEKIEKINRLYESTWNDVNAAEHPERLHLPPIFKLIENSSKKVIAIDFIRLTEDEIRMIPKTHPQPSDPELSVYTENILNAILKLKACYFSRQEKWRDDITGGVIAYLLFMLEEKCFSFCGSDYDIAYMEAMIQFVRQYAKEDPEQEKYFYKVGGFLSAAKQELQKYQENRRCESILNEMRNTCLTASQHLLRALTQLTVNADKWDLVEMATISELSEGMVSELDKVAIPASVFKCWIKGAAHYYLQTSAFDAKFNANDIMPPEKMFTYPDLTRLSVLRSQREALTVKENQELGMMEADLGALYEQFRQHPNYFTSVLSVTKSTSSSKYKAITDDATLIARTKIMADVFTVLHKIIFLQYLASHLIKNIKSLDEIYARHPQHFTAIFRVLDGVRNQIGSDISKLKKAFFSIQEAPDVLQEVLVSSYAKLEKCSKQITLYRLHLEKTIQPMELKVKSVQLELGILVNRLARLYDISPLSMTPKYPNSVPEQWKCKSTVFAASRIESELPAEAPKSVSLPNPEAVLPALPDSSLLKPEKIKIDRNSLRLGLDSMEAAAETGLDSDRTLNSPVVLDDMTQLNVGLTYMRTRITQIGKVEKAELMPSELSAYLYFYECLYALHDKYTRLMNEGSKSLERSMKAAQMLTLLLEICEQGNFFLMGDRATRIQQASEFSENIHAELMDPKNKFLDQHADWIKHGVNDFCQLSIFNTISREKAANIYDACDKIAGIYGFLKTRSI